MQAKAARGLGRCHVAMDRRLLVVALVPVLALAGTAAASSSKPVSWAAPQIRVVAAAGLMDAKDVASFRPADPLTAQSLENLAFDLKQRLAPPVVQPPAGRAAGRPDRPDGDRSDPTTHDADDHHRAAPTAPTVPTVPAPAPLAAGSPETAGEPGPAGDDRAARPPPRAVARPRQGGERVLGRRPRRRDQGARPLRHRSRRPPARAAPQPPGERGLARAPAAESRHPRRSRVLGRADPPVPRLRDRRASRASPTPSCCRSSRTGRSRS